MILKPARFTGIFLLVIIGFFLLTSSANARFNQAIVRFDRQKSDTATTGLICAEPASTGVENSVSVTFPATTELSPYLYNWTVNTSNLPPDSVAWPGIATASSISGNTVTFPSSDLQVGILYCFKWYNAQAVNTGPEGSKEGALTTKSSSSSTIDTSAFMMSIIENEQVSVTATVDPVASAAEIKIDGAPEKGTTLSPEQEVTVTLLYKSLIPGRFPLRLEGFWDKGLIEGTDTNFVDIFDYVVGSASRADDGTVPIIDLANRNIIWNIPSISSSEFHKVTFKLRVRAKIPTEKTISAKIKVRGKLGNTTLSEQYINYFIKKGTAKIIPYPFSFNYVRINEVSKNYINVSFQTNKKSIFTLFYGENPNSLNKTVTGLTYESDHTVNLPELLPETQYYFKIEAQDRSNSKAQSDLFTATTASGQDTVKLSRNDFTVHWRKYFLLHESVDSVVIPRNKSITITAKIGSSSKISSIKAVFKNNQVLGISTINPQANIQETPMIEILPGVFSGEIQSPSQAGNYTIVFEINDVTNGFYTKASPYQFYVSDPIRVIDSKTKKPIENANVNIFRYEESLRQFTSLSNSFAIQSHTDEHGELDIVLPTGKYRIEVASPSYKSTEITTELGISALKYPLLELVRDTSLAGQISYYKDSFSDLYTYTAGTTKNVFSSQRVKDLFVIFIFILLILLIILDTHIKKKLGLMNRMITLSILDVLVVSTGIATLLFIRYLGVGETAVVIASTLFVFILGFIYLKKTFSMKKK